MSRAVAEARRTLNRFEFIKQHPWNAAAQTRNWEQPYYTLRPAGFSTALATIKVSDQPDRRHDLELFFDAVQTLVNATAPPFRRKRK